MKEILLTHGISAIVDDEDWSSLVNHKWYARKHRNTWYAARNEYLGHNRWRYVTMHRLIIAAAPGQQVDHIDGNGLNNTRANLRFCDGTQNACNRKRGWGRSHFKGVSWHSQSGKWRSEATLKGKHFFLGMFEDETEAARAYDRAAIRLFGEFAHPNFPMDGVAP